MEGSSGPQGGLWNDRAADWADVMEGWNGWGVPVYRRVLERVPVAEGSTVLDVGCGAGRFLRMAADRGARVAGLDGTPALLEIARDRVLGGDFRLGEMVSLPWEDDSFDLVTGFNSFFLADDMSAVLREAARVAKPGAVVATSLFGRPERSGSTQVFKVLPDLMRPEGEEQPDAGEQKPGPPELSEDEMVQRAFADAGLTLEEDEFLTFAEEYRDLETATRGMVSAPPFRRAAAAVGEDRVRAAVAEALSQFELSDGRCRFDEESRYVIARA